MNLIQAILLGILQGITEFLPISSSGHLVLLEKFFHLPLSESALRGFDVILHLGSLIAILVYFRQDLLKLMQGFSQTLRSKQINSETRLIGNLILATVPLILAGLFLKDILDQYFRTPPAVGIMLAVTGILLFLAEKLPRLKTGEQVNVKQGVIIGLMQALALTPGLSRSGSTIVAAMLQGVKREAAARFAFLLAIPGITAAVAYVFWEILQGKTQLPALAIVSAGFFTALVSSYLSVSFFMRFISKHKLSLFSYYLFLVSGILLFS